MPDKPAEVAEKTTTPPGGGEKTTPVAETENKSNEEWARLRNIAGTTERVIQERDEARAKLAAREKREQLEALVLQVAEAQKVDPNVLLKHAPNRTKEELEELAKDLPKTGEKPGRTPMTLNSTRSSGGGTRLGDLPPLERMKRVAEKLREG